MFRGALAVALPIWSIGGRPVNVINTQRWTQPRALPDHLRNLHVGQHQPVLDRVAAAIERALQAFSAVGVASHLLAPAMCFVHNRSQFLHRQRRLRYQLAILSNTVVTNP